MMGEGGAVPSPGLQRLLQAIRDYRPAEGGEELVALRHAIDLLELKFSVHSGQYAESMEWDRQGYRTPVEFFRYEAHMPSGIAADRVDVGLQYENLERSVDAVAKGEIGFAHLAAMARTAEWLEQRDRDFDESWLLDKARTLTVTRFRRACEHLRHRQDPKEFAREEQDAHERRFLELSPAEDGSLWLRGMLDPEGAAVMRSSKR